MKYITNISIIAYNVPRKAYTEIKQGNTLNVTTITEQSDCRPFVTYICMGIEYRCSLETIRFAATKLDKVD